MYDVYLNESNQCNIYIENDLDPNKDDEDYENFYDLPQNDSNHYDIYHKNAFDSSLFQQVLRDGVTSIKERYAESNDDLHQRVTKHNLGTINRGSIAVKELSLAVYAFLNLWFKCCSLTNHFTAMYII